jgi:hypothetical protein
MRKISIEHKEILVEIAQWQAIPPTMGGREPLVRVSAATKGWLGAQVVGLGT